MESRPPFAAMHATLSGIDQDEKKYFSEILIELGGVYSRNLTSSCTHVFSTTRFSEKAKAARLRGITVLHPEYLKAKAQEYKKEGGRNESGLSSIKEKAYVLPCLAGANISVTGFSKSYRSDLKALVESLGGHYTATLTLANTHLLAEKEGGEKHSFACRYGIKVVHPSWLVGSHRDAQAASCQWCRREEDYLVGSSVAHQQSSCQTPWPHTSNTVVEETQTSPWSISSRAPSRFHKTRPCISQPAPTTISNSSESQRMKCCVSMDSGTHDKAAKVLHASSLGPNTGFSRQKRSFSMSAERAHDRVLSPAELCLTIPGEAELDCCLADIRQGATPFLRECQVYLSGFAGMPEIKKRIMRMLLHGEATRVAHINDLVTHVICGGIHPSDLEAINSLATKPVLVTCHWLLASFQQGKMLPCHPYQLEIVSLPNLKSHALSLGPLAVWPAKLGAGQENWRKPKRNHSAKPSLVDRVATVPQ